MKIKYELEFDFNKEVRDQIKEDYEYLKRRFKGSHSIHEDEMLRLSVENAIGQTLSSEEVEIIMGQFDKIKEWWKNGNDKYEYC